MKMHFTLIIDGEDSLEAKFKKAVEENPNLHMDLINVFTHAVMKSLKLDQTDKITVTQFKAAKLVDASQQSTK